MSWILSVAVALLTAIVGLLASGWVANLVVGWYRISSFEGGSGYFVVGLALVGGIVGFIVGLAASRIVAAGASPGFLKAAGTSLGAMLALVGAVGGTARLLADVPPTIAGEALTLVVEVRWPPDRTESPAKEIGESTRGILTLGAVNRATHVRRKSVRGPFWLEDSRLVDGRWVTPGAVNLFTARGVRSLDIAIGDSSVAGYIVPLGGHPAERDLEWSEWLPRARDGAPPLPDGFRYRYRVQRVSAPVRTIPVGAFEVVMVDAWFHDHYLNGRTVLGASAAFEIRHGGKLVVLEGADPASGAAVRLERVSAVATLPSTIPALLVRGEQEMREGYCFLVPADSAGARSELVSPCLSLAEASELTHDLARLGERRTPGGDVPGGEIDRRTFVRPGLYLFSRAVLDTRTLAVHRIEIPEDVIIPPSTPPLALSPDERSFVRFAFLHQSDETPGLLVTDFVAGATYTLPIDAERMRLPDVDELDPAWLAEHFRWTRGPDGRDRLVERQ
jgi:hypothetical protein